MYQSSYLINIAVGLSSCWLFLITLLWLWYQNKFKYWTNRNVKQLSPVFPVGNVYQISTGTGKHTNLFFKELYLENRDIPFLGFYTFYNPALLVNDLELIKHIMVKDADYFNSHGMLVDSESNALSGHLFNLEGSEWKQMRSKLSPTFTSAKTKMMYNIMLEVSKEMYDYVEPIAKNGGDVDFKEIFAKYSTDVIGRCAFGIDCNTFKEPNSEFRKNGARIFEFTSILRSIVEMAAMFVPEIIRYFKIKVDDPQLETFFTSLVLSSVKYREANNIQRNDFLDLLIKLKNNTLTDDKGNLIESGGLSLKQITAQVFIFFGAGFETASTASSFTLYEMALNRDLQEKLRKEILETLEQHDGQCTYEAIQKMTYLDCVIRETLRKYPPGGLLPRRCLEDYKVPNHNLTIEKGTLIFISSAGLHMDDRYFPEPEKYDPDRFLPENKADIPSNAYIPFGEGPRFCIGERFGFMQTRLSIINIITKCEVSVCDRTHVPMEYSTNGLVMSSKDGMWLKLNKI